jgi:RimJ/RimL family protein N-acetyltransferase
MLMGKKVSVRHVLEEDLPELLSQINDLEGRGDYSSKLMRAPMQFQKSFEENGLSSEKFEMLAIVDGQSRLVGNLVHLPTRAYTRTRELGYRIFSPNLWGQGYATEAVTLLVDYLFENRTLNRLEICMDPRNRASERIAQKCGFRHEGTMRGQVFYAGSYADAHLYGLTRADWAMRGNFSPTLSA